MSIKAKIESLGLTLPVAALPVAAYVPAVRTGNLVFVAGQLPLVDGKIVKEGKVGKEVTPEEAKEMAQVCALNALAAIALVADIDQIERIVRVGGFVNGIPGFVAIPGVINGASELFIKLFGEVNGKHARTAIGVAELPFNAPVEVEVVIQLSSFAERRN
jgi:enamine deaminase RidA (YjgF/YER057c/UK114 family)